MYHLCHLPLNCSVGINRSSKLSFSPLVQTYLDLRVLSLHTLLPSWQALQSFHLLCPYQHEGNECQWLMIQLQGRAVYAFNAISSTTLEFQSLLQRKCGSHATNGSIQPFAWLRTYIYSGKHSFPSCCWCISHCPGKCDHGECIHQILLRTHIFWVTKFFSNL